MVSCYFDRWGIVLTIITLAFCPITSILYALKSSSGKRPEVTLTAEYATAEDMQHWLL